MGMTRAIAAELGAEVTNVATGSYMSGSDTIALTTPPAIFIIEAQRTPSTIDFLRYSPLAPNGVSYRLRGSDYLDNKGFISAGWESDDCRTDYC